MHVLSIWSTEFPLILNELTDTDPEKIFFCHDDDYGNIWSEPFQTVPFKFRFLVFVVIVLALTVF